MDKVKCPYCNYKWSYKGKLIRACCPSCRRGVLVSENKIDEKTEEDLNE